MSGSHRKLGRKSLPDASTVEDRLDKAASLVKRRATREARVILDKVLRAAPENRLAHTILNHSYVMEGDWDGLRRAVAIQHRLGIGPELVAWNQSQLSLRLGDMPMGWDQFESRWKVPGLVIPKRAFSEPSWDGGSFAGKTLLLHWEQGLGDTIMLVRYAKNVKALGGRVVLEAQKPLAELVTTCSGLDEVIPFGAPLPSFDLQLPLFSLPRVFRTTLDSIPAEIPYLDIPPCVPNRERIVESLALAEGKTRIGLVWAGNRSHKGDALRSMPVAALACFRYLADVAWYSFQIDTMEQPELPGLIVMDPLLRNFSDTAYALSGMDLVITVDTAVAHLAGALGIPTLLLLPFYPDWRWMLKRLDSPWYPSMRLYRQSTPGDWEGVLQQVVTDLTEGP